MTQYLPLAEVHSAVDALNQTVDGIISQLQAATVKLEVSTGPIRMGREWVGQGMQLLNANV